MKSKPDWDSLSHTDQLKVLRDTAVDQITADYRFGDADDSAFRGRLARELALWQPHRFDGLPKQMGNPPNKEVVLGAWRDLDRSEAILELIDNSMDASTVAASDTPTRPLLNSTSTSISMLILVNCHTKTTPVVFQLTSLSTWSYPATARQTRSFIALVATRQAAKKPFFASQLRSISRPCFGTRLRLGTLQSPFTLTKVG